MSKPDLGIIGGGQLGSLLASAAKKLNIKTVILSDDKDAPAVNFADEFIYGDYQDINIINNFLEKVDLVTYEFENIPYDILKKINETKAVLPSPEINKLIQNNCSKKFHVSPFIEMDCNYFFRILNPGDKLSVIIDQYDQEGKILFASQDGIRSDLTNKNLMNSYLKHPLMTFKIISAIHFEAFKLWIKGIKFVKKKLKIKNNITVEN